MLLNPWLDTYHLFPPQLQEFDNSNNHNTTIQRTVQVTESKEVNGKEYTRDLNETSKEEAQKYAPLHLPVTLVKNIA